MTAVVEPTSESTTETSDKVLVPQLAAIIAEFPSVAAVVAAAKQIRSEGWTAWDVHSPFPIHGIDDVIGIRPTRLPWITFCAGVLGIITALVMQWWMNAIDYPFWISGKPFFGLPAAVPVTFELMILFAAISTLVGMLLLNGLPKLANPLLRSDLFLRTTSDRFVICISANDPQFDREKARQSLTNCHPLAIDECFALPATENRWPAFVPGVVTVLVVCMFIPPVLVAQRRSTTTTQPRYHVIQDMDFQPKFKPQRTSTLFPDGRAMRPQVTGSVARGDLRADSRFYKGLVSGGGSGALAFAAPTPSLDQVTKLASSPTAQKLNVQLVSQAQAPAPDPLDSYPWVTTFPVEATAKTMKRGQERYNIYCATCHGLAGDGDGLVTRRALELEQGTWIKPTSFHSDNLRAQPVGRMFHSISNGVRKMPGYADLVTVEDRWAILLYVRALQQSRNADVKDIPADLVPQLHDLPKE